MSRRRPAPTEQATTAPAKSCPRCGRQSTDGHLCESCAWHTRNSLRSLVNWWPDLFDTFTRQDRTTPQSEGHGLHHEKPLPFDVRAAELANEIRQTFVGWVRVTVEDYGAPWPADRISAMEDHLSRWTGRLRTHEAAAEYAKEIDGLADRITKVIDTADGQLVHITTADCPNVTEAGRCGGELVGHIKRDWFASAFVRCRSCSMTWDARQWVGLQRLSRMSAVRKPMDAGAVRRLAAAVLDAQG